MFATGTRCKVRFRNLAISTAFTNPSGNLNSTQILCQPAHLIPLSLSSTDCSHCWHSSQAEIYSVLYATITAITLRSPVLPIMEASCLLLRNQNHFRLFSKNSFLYTNL